jgi:hypothetical protein
MVALGHEVASAEVATVGKPIADKTQEKPWQIVALSTFS